MFVFALSFSRFTLRYFIRCHFKANIKAQSGRRGKWQKTAIRTCGREGGVRHRKRVEGCSVPVVQVHELSSRA